MQLSLSWKPKQKSALEFLTAALAPILFIWYKLANLAYRYSDHNLYFFYADKILHGAVPFRDFFMTDPALYDYILAGIKFFSRGHLLFLQALPVVVAVLNAFLIYALLKKYRAKLAFLAPALYLFCFSTLANTDYATGEQWAILFLLAALLLWQNQKPFWSGLLWAFACLTKLYIGAALIGFIVYALFSANKKQLPKLIVGGIIPGAAWLGAFSVITPNKFWYSLIGFHLARPEGLSKANIYLYFLQHEAALLILGLIGLVMLRKKPAIAAFAGLAAFFLIFKDLYYLYLQTLIPFLVIGEVYLISWIWQKAKDGPIYASAVLAALIPFILYSISFYAQNWLTQGRFENATEVSQKVAELPDNFPLYGTYETTPLVSLLSHRDIFKNYYDTNPISFWNGRLDKTKISQEAVENGVYLVARITNYPQFGISESGYEQYFDQSLFKQYCRPALSFPSASNQGDNYLNIYRCKK